MAVNLEFAGRAYPPTPARVVPAARITAFADAVGADHPVHHDPEAAKARGYSGVVASPTFAVVIAQESEAQYIADPDAGIDFDRVVHGEQRFTHHQPIVGGDEVVATLHIDALRQAGGHTMVTTRTELTRPAGDRLSTVVSMIVVRGDQASEGAT
ncbi:MAG: MaoC family dehydratase N-terminal domain-containing protein [Ornithinimicrobium sp.]